MAGYKVLSYLKKEGNSMNPITIRIIAGILCAVFVTIIFVRRNRMAAKRRPLP